MIHPLISPTYLLPLRLEFSASLPAFWGKEKPVVANEGNRFQSRLPWLGNLFVMWDIQPVGQRTFCFSDNVSIKHGRFSIT